MTKAKLLIIDDEHDILEVLRDILHYKGYEVLTSANGPAGIDLVEKERPELVLLDLHMPKLDGRSVLREIREIDPRIGVIMMSGDANADRAELLLEGARDFIAKPIDFDHLEKAIARK